MQLEGWQEKTLDAVIQRMEGGGTPSKKNAAYWNGCIPWASVKDLTGYTLSKTEDFITEEGLQHSSSKLIPAGTLIVGTRMAVGKAVRFSIDVAINQDLRALYPKPDVSTEFLHQWFIANEKNIEALGSGSTVKGIRQEVLKSLPILLPPSHEQEAIADILQCVDETIQKTQAVIDQTDKLKQSVLLQLFQSDASKHSERLSSHINLISGQHIQSDKVNKSGKGTPYLTGPADFPSGEIAVSKYATDPKSMCQKGDILLTVKGSGTGKMIMADNDYCISRQLMAIRAKDWNAAYIYYALTSRIDMLKANAVGFIPGLSRSDILNVTVPSIDVSEQEYVGDLLANLDDSIKTNQVALKQLIILKTGLMSDLLSGRVRVNGIHERKEAA